MTNTAPSSEHLKTALEALDVIAGLAYHATSRTDPAQVLESLQAIQAKAEEARGVLGQAQRLHAPDVSLLSDQAAHGSLRDLSALVDLAPDYAEMRDLLGRALPVAERIDEKRGRVLNDAIGGSVGWDIAEEVNQLLARVELDSCGTRGRGLE